MEKIAWLVLGGIALGAAWPAWKGSARALRVGRIALGVLYVGAGALVNAIYLLTGDNYSKFADAAHIDFVRDTWRSTVVPNHTFFITLLVAFELAVGVMVLSGGRLAEVGMLGALAMHVGLLPFGWVITIWSLAMLLAIGLLLAAQHRDNRRHAAAPESMTSPGQFLPAR